MTARPTRDPTVLVTGGSSGIGAAVARRAGAAGWRVLVGYATGSARAAEVAGGIVRAGGQAEPVWLPLTDPRRIESACDDLCRRDVVPDALVLSASRGPNVKAFAKLSEDDLRADLEVAVLGNHCLIASAWRKFFRHRGGGHVVALLSAALGPPPTPHMASYVTAKAALLALLQCACAEYGRGGLRVSALSPGYTETPMLGCFGDLFLERERAERGFLDPDDVAAAVLAQLAAPPPPGEVTHVPAIPRVAPATRDAERAAKEPFDVS